MSFDLKAFGIKLSRCRNNLELLQQEVSNAVGIPENRLNDFEKGVVEPSGDEVLILSDYFKQDYYFFISNEQKSASEQVDILYRKFGQNISKHDRRVIQEFIFLCESEEYILKHLNFQRRIFSYEANGNYFKGQGFDGAANLRKFLGFNDDHIISDFYQELRKIGIHIFRRRLENSNISGLFINHPYAGKCILVNYSEDVFRQNFTIAHEAGHAVFDFRDIVNISFENENGKDYREIRANAFASSLLVPLSLANKFKNIMWTDNHILKTALQLKVNPPVLAIALQQMKVLEFEDLNRFMKLKIPKEKKQDSELHNLSPRIYDAKRKCFELGLSSFYIMNCHQAYSKGIISASKMAEMLLTNNTELPSLLKLFNLQLVHEY